MGDQVTPQTLQDIDRALARWRRVAGALTFRKAWPWKMRIRVEITELIDGIEIRAALRAPDIVTGEEQWVHMLELVTYQRVLQSDDAQIGWCMRTLLLNLVTHEFDECLLLGGEQMRDPHASSRSPLRAA